MRIHWNNGFTMVELLCIISISCLTFPVVLPAIIDAKTEAKDAEAKANLHTIQSAIERYATDHYEYPPYLLGGDRDGWEYWHEQWDEADPDPEKPANNWVSDPLIEYGYMVGYPMNPFLSGGEGNLIIVATSFIADPKDGDGDPRFGFQGNVMGMGLDDPNYFEDAHPNLPYSRIETKRTLDRGTFDPTEHGFPGRDKRIGTEGLYYNWGGMYNSNTGKDILTFWPGNFFYRGYVEVIPSRGGYSWPYPNANYQGMVTNYYLGVWGSSGNSGMDVIRLQNVTPDGSHNQVHWRFPPPWSGDSDFPCGYSGSMYSHDGIGLPAVFGGGDAEHGPYWPPDRDDEHFGEMIYGAPDGVPDGIILTLQDSEK